MIYIRKLKADFWESANLLLTDFKLMVKDNIPA